MSVDHATAHERRAADHGSHREFRRSRRVLWYAAAAATVLGCFLVVVALGVGSATFIRAYDDITQAIAAGLGTTGALLAVSRTSGRIRSTWILVAVGTGCWAVGQAWWTVEAVVLHQAPTAVSPAAPFFCLFAVIVAIGLIHYHPADRWPQRWRRLMDGAIVATAIFTIVWCTSLAHTVESGELPFAEAIVYLGISAGDIIAITVAVNTLNRRGSRTPALWLLTTGLAAIAVSDACFVFFMVIGRYDTGVLDDTGWVLGFLLIGLAGIVEGSSDPMSRRFDLDRSSIQQPLLTRPGWQPESSTMVPYIPLAAAIAVVLSLRLFAHMSDPVAEGALVVATLVLLIRQYVTIRDNRTLVSTLAVREHELQDHAFNDALTGLPNRAAFTDRALTALGRHSEDGRRVSLLFIDIDDFKAINDTLGHGVGDQLVAQIARRMRDGLGPHNLLARFGGDEFAVLIEDANDPVAVGTGIIEMLRTPIEVASGPVFVRTSIGVAEACPNEPTPSLDRLFSRADIAMYAAKRSGKGRVVAYDPSMVVPDAEDVRLRPALAAAVAGGELDIVFQPIVHLATGEVRAVEALARWRHDGQIVPPGYFIQLAARSGLIPDLTDLMLVRALEQLREWSDRLGLTDLQVSVNVHPTLFGDPDFPRRVAAVLAETRTPPHRLILEITEDALLGDIDVSRAVAERLRALGVGLSMDDFGTGYASLLSLLQIPLQSFKIDIAFIAEIDRDPEAERFLAALLALGRDLRMTVTAEGVERPAQAEILAALGCQLVQGYLFARPQPAAEVEPVLLSGMH